MRQKNYTLDGYIKQFTQEAAARLAPFIAAGKLNIEFIKGNQRKYVSNLYKLEDKPANSAQVYTEKKIFNRVLPIYLTRYGILTKNMPFPGFKPQDCTAKRQFDSVRGNTFIKNYVTDIQFKDIYNRLVTVADTYGLAWIKTGIDWSKGDEIAKIDMSTQINDNAESKDKVTYTLKEGRPFLEVVPMYEVFIDNMHASTMNEINELVHRRAFTCSYIRRRWGIEVQPEKVDAVTIANAPRFIDKAFGIADDNEYAYVYEYYKKPDAEYPQGRYVLMVGSNIITDDILPYVNMQNHTRAIPFDMVVLQSVPNYTVGVTVYSQIIPIQETYNDIKNRYLEYINHLAIGQIYVYEGSLTNPRGFSTKPGKIIELKRNSKPPTPVQKAQIGAEFIQYLHTLEEDMLITAGLSQLTAFGSARSNIRTDGVVDKVDESDQNKLVNALENLCNSIISAFKKVLYNEQERVRILQEELKLSNRDDYIVKYKLKNIDPEQLSIVNKDFLMQDDQILDKKIQQANNMGLYNPESGFSYLSKIHLLDSMQSNYLLDTLDPSEKAQHDLIESEHFEILDDRNMPRVEPYHLHDQHILEHNIFRISPEVRLLKKEDPEAYKIIMELLDSHIKQHEDMVNNSKKPNPMDSAKALFGGTGR